MQSLTLAVTPRDTGKKAVKATRREGLVPCVIYGPHLEPVHFAAEALSLRPLIHTTEQYRIEVDLDGELYDAVLKDVVFHPVTDRPWHVDFQALTAGETFTTTVPIVLVGTPEAVKDGADLAQPNLQIEIRALPKDLPGHIDLDVSEMIVGDSLHVRDLILPEGVEVLTDPDRTIATVSLSTLGAELDELDAAAAEEEASGLDIEAAEAADGDPMRPTSTRSRRPSSNPLSSDPAGAPGLVPSVPAFLCAPRRRGAAPGTPRAARRSPYRGAAPRRAGGRVPAVSHGVPLRLPRVRLGAEVSRRGAHSFCSPPTTMSILSRLFGRAEALSVRPDLVVIGLGNPGAPYDGTRHNAGFEVADRLAARLGTGWTKAGPLGLVVQGEHRGAQIAVVKPQAFMNRSGTAAAEALRRTGLDAAALLVVVDDLALDVGEIRMRAKGGSGGHNGLADIADALDTTSYPRLRVGVGSDFPPGGQVDFVLAPFPESDQVRASASFDYAAEAALAVATDGLALAMSRYNGPAPDSPESAPADA